MCKINPKIDFAFKKLFGSEENKDLLISLINAVISQDQQIKEVVLKNPYNLAAYKEGKMSILDIKACDEKGRWYNVEMQVGEDLHFDKRAIYYWAKLLTEQLQEGRFYKHINKTISICFLDFDYISNNPNFHNQYKILNTETETNGFLHDVFERHFIELGKFKKDYQEIATVLDRWATFLNRAHELKKDKLPAAMAMDQNIVRAVEAVDRMFDEEEREIYDIRFHAQVDFESKLLSAHEVGKRKRSEEIAKNLIAAGVDVSTIEKSTGLSRQEIEYLRQS